MKNWKKLSISVAVAAAVMTSGIAMSAYADAQNNSISKPAKTENNTAAPAQQAEETAVATAEPTAEPQVQASESETQALREAFLGAQETALQMGKFPAEYGEQTGTTAEMTEEERNACVQAYTKKVEQYYASGSACRQSYIEQNEALLRNVYQTKVNYLMDGGVLDCDLTEALVSTDGTTATVKATWTEWNKWVEQNEAGQYEVTAPVNRNTATVTMVKEEGCWKIQSTDDLCMECADDVTDKLSTLDAGAGVLSEMEQAQEICGNSYATFTEALAAAKTIDGNGINPYSILEKYSE